MSGVLRNAGIAAALALCACGSGRSDETQDDGFPRDFPSTRAAMTAVPAAIRIDFDALLSCRGDLAVRKGEKVPELDNARIADVVDELRRDPRAAEKCMETLHSGK